MSGFLRVLVAFCLAGALGARAAAGEFEAMKSAGLAAAWESALKNAPPAPASARAGALPAQAGQEQVQVYERGGYAWSSDAENAMLEAERGLRSAGIAVLSAVTSSEEGGSHAFRIEYADDSAEGVPPRSIESYESRTYSFESDAQNDLSRAKSNLRSSGWVVVLGEVRRQRQSPWDYTYRIDYVRSRWNPRGSVHLYVSGLYARAADAERDRVMMEHRLRAEGYYVFGSALYQDSRSRGFFFQIRYGSALGRR